MNLTKRKEKKNQVKERPLPTPKEKYLNKSKHASYPTTLSIKEKCFFVLL
jgi:hypothetical protein